MSKYTTTIDTTVFLNMHEKNIDIEHAIQAVAIINKNITNNENIETPPK